jgi:hypothetical protein
MTDEKPGFWQQYKDDFKKDLRDAEQKRLSKPSFIELQEQKLQTEADEIFKRASELRKAKGKYLVVDLHVNMLGYSGNVQAIMNGLFEQGWALSAANGSETIVMGASFTHWHLVFEDSRLKSPSS